MDFRVDDMLTKEVLSIISSNVSAKRMYLMVFEF